MDDHISVLEAQSLRDFEMAELVVVASAGCLDSASLFRSQRAGPCSTAASGASSVFSSPDRRSVAYGEDVRSPLRALTNTLTATSDVAAQPQPWRSDSKPGWSPRLARPDDDLQPPTSPGHIIARNYPQRPLPSPAPQVSATHWSCS